MVQSGHDVCLPALYIPPSRATPTTIVKTTDKISPSTTVRPRYHRLSWSDGCKTFKITLQHHPKVSEADTRTVLASRCHLERKPMSVSRHI